MLRWYQARLAKQPILTASVTSALLFGSGDVLAQQLVDRKGFDKHDMARTGRMALYGGAIFGPAATTWYGVLQRHVVLSSAKTTLLARVVADQCVFTPAHLTCFLSSMAIMEGTDPIEKWRNGFVPSFKANLAIWPLVQGVNFAIVPLEYRVLFVNLVALGWNCLLSLINSGEK
ncbi:Mpv17/PMP22 family protein [Aspergillus vadensis CBS 113365]|uniref:Integral membrane protein, Mpv17/PMP22 family n=1 Tax=Aspergillus vadensis (strain CBS 113365 / IMI 142717 / IBT 24658) TaxID=1448311 RepID=A0A319BQ09_ASPVC|nr:integral membrane protein, Mpv17/PMP22 family [Aspergillus vadensis CBS 113365]PYH67783.1 integral membrane protein, Mpv17/PMP22 family [Aspergillus vadensis CBS 113365]